MWLTCRISKYLFARYRFYEKKNCYCGFGS